MNAPEKIPFLHFDLEEFSVNTYKGDTPPVQFIDDTLLIRSGAAGTLAGEGGISKSYWGLQRGLQHAARGLPFIGIFCEDGRDDLDRRIGNYYKVEKRLKLECAHIIPTSRASEDFRLIQWNETFRSLDRLPALDWLEAKLTAWHAEGRNKAFVVLDNASSLLAVDPNKPEQVQPAMNILSGLAERTESAILVIHHFNKGPSTGSGANRVITPDTLRSRIRGSTGFVDGVRYALVMYKPDSYTIKEVCEAQKLPLDSDIVAASIVKANGPCRKWPLYMRRCPKTGVLTELLYLEIESPADALLRLIRESAAQGRYYTRTGKTGLHENRSDQWPAALEKLRRDPIQQLAKGMVDSGVLIESDGWLYVKEEVSA